MKWTTFGLAICVAIAGCNHSNQSSCTTCSAVGGDRAMSIELRSEAFGDGKAIPVKFTGDGSDVSPPLAWSNLPQGTRELALIVDDPDAPRPKPFVHWVIYKIPPALTGLGEGVERSPRPAQVPGAIQGPNSGNVVGYMGPAPPKGHGTHHYHFRLYALSKELDVGPGLDKDRLLQAMQGNILAEAHLMGTYERK